MPLSLAEEKTAHENEEIKSRMTFFFGDKFILWQLMMVVLTGVFMFGAPFWSWFFNDYLRWYVKSCETPATLIQCGSGADYTAIAVKLNRTLRGQYIGCGCDDGILGDWSCAVNVPCFSLSYFVSSAPGTGCMAALTAWPVLSGWVYVPKKDAINPRASEWHFRAEWYAQVSFQFFYGLFLINTLCVNPQEHAIVVVAFIVSMVIHFAMVAFVFGGCNSSRGILIYGLIGFALVSEATGSLWPVSPSWLGQHAFWLGECVALVTAFSLMPVLTYLDYYRKPKVGLCSTIAVSTSTTC